MGPSWRNIVSESINKFSRQISACTCLLSFHTKRLANSESRFIKTQSQKIYPGLMHNREKQDNTPTPRFIKKNIPPKPRNLWLHKSPLHNKRKKSQLLVERAGNKNPSISPPPPSRSFHYYLFTVRLRTLSAQTCVQRNELGRKWSCPNVR
jgi:hypothetical protein